MRRPHADSPPFGPRRTTAVCLLVITTPLLHLALPARLFILYSSPDTAPWTEAAIAPLLLAAAVALDPGGPCLRGTFRYSNLSPRCRRERSRRRTHRHVAAAPRLRGARRPRVRAALGRGLPLRGELGLTRLWATPERRLRRASAEAPWEADPGYAVLLGLSQVVLACALVLVPAALRLAARPWQWAAVVAASAGAFVVGTVTAVSGLVDRAVDVPVFGSRALLVGRRDAGRVVPADVAAPRRLPTAGRPTDAGALAAGVHHSAAALLFVSRLLIPYASYDTAPWSEAAIAPLLLAAASALKPWRASSPQMLLLEPAARPLVVVVALDRAVARPLVHRDRLERACRSCRAGRPVTPLAGEVLQVPQQPGAEPRPAPGVVHPHPLHLGGAVREPLHSPARHRLAVARRRPRRSRRAVPSTRRPAARRRRARSRTARRSPRSTPPSPRPRAGRVGRSRSNRTVAARTSRSAVASASVSRSRCRGLSGATRSRASCSDRSSSRRHAVRPRRVSATRRRRRSAGSGRTTTRSSASSERSSRLR